MSIETIITSIILVIVVIAILYIISIWVYKRAPANMGFIRTGFLGTKVCLGGGAIVLPVFHEVTWISLETIKLIATRSRDQAILTADKIRIDVVTELYAHVGHTVDDLLTAGRSLGEKTFDPEKVRSLLEAKIVSALRSYAATKTLSELHENRDAFAREIKQNVLESFHANGLTLEEVTIVTLEQTDKEYFDANNVFDAEGLKVITELTSDARRRVHETEKRTTVSIRQKDLDTQLELLEIERQEAFARAGQDKDIANEQALQIGQKQIYVLDQRMAVENKEIDNDKTLERLRTERDINAITEAERRETADIQKSLTIEQERRDREIALLAKAREEETAEIARTLSREKAEQDKQIELSAKEKDRQQADISRDTAIASHEEAARDERHQAAEQATIAMRKRSLETQLTVLELEKEEAFATSRQEQEVSKEQARMLSEKQRHILEQRWQVEQEEISKGLALEQAEIQKEVQIIDETKQREAAEIRQALAREQEERDREVALVGKDEELERSRVRKTLAVEVAERERDIALIAKDQEREKADIQRALAREQEERDRQIAVAAKNREVEQAEVKRLQMTSERERAEHEAESVRLVADADRKKIIDRVHAQAESEVRQNRGTEQSRHCQHASGDPGRGPPACIGEGIGRHPDLGPGQQRIPADQSTWHGARGRGGRAGRDGGRDPAGAKHRAYVRGRGHRDRGQGGRVEKIQRVSHLSGAGQDAHRSRARCPYGPGQSHGHRVVGGTDSNVWRRERHSGYHPAVVYLRLWPGRSFGGGGSRVAGGGTRSSFPGRYPGSFPTTQRARPAA